MHCLSLNTQNYFLLLIPVRKAQPRWTVPSAQRSYDKWTRLEGASVKLGGKQLNNRAAGEGAGANCTHLWRGGMVAVCCSDRNGQSFEGMELWLRVLAHTGTYYYDCLWKYLILGVRWKVPVCKLFDATKINFTSLLMNWHWRIEHLY